MITPAAARIGSDPQRGRGSHAGGAPCRRAGIADGQSILDAGCGWGALSLYVAERFPRCRVVAVSNSAPQRNFIEGRCRERHLASVEVRTADIDAFEPRQSFDRILSIEMFEHLRNYRDILRRFSYWLKPDGMAFVHIFCHREYAYLYEEVYGAGNEKRWFQRWRIFFMACSELWGYRGGEEWWVGHCRFGRR